MNFTSGKILRLFLPPAMTVVLCVAFFSACRKGPRSAGEGEVLVRIGDVSLTRGQMDSELPPAADRNDSVRRSRAYIRAWIDNRLLEEVAGKTLQNMETIDWQVEEYRRELIAREYISRHYAASTAEGFPQDSVLAYYRADSLRFALEKPVIKGIYVKLPANFPRLGEIRRLIRSNRTEDIDRLEKEVYNAAVHYDYFRDRWVDAGQLDLRIPFDPTVDPMALIRGRRDIEVRQGEYVYLVNITDFRDAGQPAPFDFVQDKVRQAMEFERRGEVERALRRDLLRQADEKGLIELSCDLSSE